MTEDELKKWFDEIAAKAPGGNNENFQSFLPDAETAIEAAFPKEHSLVRQWHKQRDKADKPSGWDVINAQGQLLEIFKSAHSQLKAGRRGSFTSVVRSAAENDLLGVADELLDTNFPSAAAGVMAGGALEVHLRGLCDRQGVKWEGNGKIENYKAALEREHKANPPNGINTTDGKLVTAWGGLRNEAAHGPDKFTQQRTPDEVRAMIMGIREFIARTT